MKQQKQQRPIKIINGTHTRREMMNYQGMMDNIIEQKAALERKESALSKVINAFFATMIIIVAGLMVVVAYQ